MVDVVVVSGTLLAGLIGFELLSRLTKIPQSVMRKVIHVAMSLVVIGFTFIADYQVMIWTGLFFALLLLVARKVFRFYSLRDRSNESWGEILFPLGIGLSALIASDHTIFIAAILILSFSDTIAYIVGNKFPNSRAIIAGRTIAGSGAGFITSLVILLALQYGILLSLVTAGIVAIAEVFSRRGFDNISMPVAVAVFLSFIGSFFYYFS